MFQMLKGKSRPKGWSCPQSASPDCLLLRLHCPCLLPPSAPRIHLQLAGRGSWTRQKDLCIHRAESSRVVKAWGEKSPRGSCGWMFIPRLVIWFRGGCQALAPFGQSGLLYFIEIRGRIDRDIVFKWKYYKIQPSQFNWSTCRGIYQQAFRSWETIIGVLNKIRQLRCHWISYFFLEKQIMWPNCWWTSSVVFN